MIRTRHSGSLPDAPLGEPPVAASPETYEQPKWAPDWLYAQAVTTDDGKEPG